MNDDMFEEIQGFIQSAFDPGHPVHENSGFAGYVQDVVQGNPGILYALNQDRVAFGALYRRFEAGRESTREALMEDAAPSRSVTVRNSMASVGLSTEDASTMERGHPRGGDYEDLAKERRELYFKQEDGSYRLLEGQRRKDNGQLWFEEGSEADRWPAIRHALISQSFQQDPIRAYDNSGNYTNPVQSFVPLSFRGTNTEFIAPTPNGPRPSQARMPKGSSGGTGGRYASAPQLTFEFKQGDALTSQIGEHIREQIAYNYTHSTIHQDTGTLLKAIEESDIKVTVGEDGKELLVVITLADIPRPPQPGRDGSQGKPAEEVTTGQYGSWVFRGRRGIFVTDGFMRFNAGEHGYNSQEKFGNWHTTRSVMASDPHPEVFTLSQENMNQLYKDIQYMVKNSLSVQNARKGGE